VPFAVELLPVFLVDGTWNVPTTLVDGTWNVPTTLVDGTWNVPTTLNFVGDFLFGCQAISEGLHYR
jgi:hypothetical protein